MKILKKFLKNVDIFEKRFSFRHKNKESHQTTSGEFSAILFLILVIIMGIYYFIPFAHEKIIQLYIIQRTWHLPSK